MPWKYVYFILLTLLFYKDTYAQDEECTNQAHCHQIVLSHTVQIKGHCVYLRILFRNMTEELLPVGAFRLCRHTAIVDMSNNKIRIIKAGAFLGLASLQELYLANNLVEHIEPGTFHTLTNLEVFVFTGNKLTSLPEYEFTSKKLRFFNIYNNRIHNIPSTAFLHLHTPELIDLSLNNLHVISPAIISNVKPGVKLVLNNNHLTNLTLKFNGTSKSKQLSSLEASGNNIPRLTNGTLGECYKLRLTSIDLSFNFITQILAGTFDRYSTLTSLYLSHNYLRVLPPNLFKNLNSLNILDVSYNYLTYHVFDVFLPDSLTAMNASHNNIDRFVEYHWSSRVKRRYISLDISNNSITTLDANRVCRYMYQINLLYNKWKCSVLYAIVHTLQMRGINVIAGTNYKDDNVNGIPCEMGVNRENPEQTDVISRQTLLRPIVTTTTTETVNDVNDISVAALQNVAHCKSSNGYGYFLNCITVVVVFRSFV